MLSPALLGTLVGILAALFPGFHTNLIAVIVATMQLDVWFASVFLVAVAISRSIADAVPTVFLGAAEDVMALLPGHKLLKQGCGVEAVKFCVIGSLFGIMGGTLLIPLFIKIFPILFSLIRPYLFWILQSQQFKDFIDMIKSGSTIKHLYQETFENFQFVLPNTLDEQHKIIEFLYNKTAKLDSIISKTSNQIENLKEFHQSLISEVVNGKIDVRQEVVS